MAWSIAPTDATIDSNGKATITSRGTSNKVYTITYTDTNGCTASTTYTLKGYNCDDDVHINSTIPTLSSAGTSVQIGTYTREAHDYISFTPTYNWLHLTAETNGNISMYADTNTDPERSTSVEVSMNGSGCTTFNVTQEAGEQPCTCDDFSASTDSLSFGAGADSSTVTFSKTGDCTGNLTSLTPSTNDSWITPTFNSSHDTLTISVSENTDTTTGRTGHTVVSYGDCNVVNIEVQQAKATPVACTCEDISIHENALIFEQSGHTNYEEDYYEIYLVDAQSECKNSVTVNTNGADWLTVVTYETDDAVYWIPIVEANNTYFSRKANVTISINGVECGSVKVIQDPKCEDKTYNDTIYLSGFSTHRAWPSDFKLEIINGDHPSIVYANETYLCEYVGVATPFTYETIRVSATGGTDSARVFKTEITHPKTNHTAIEDFNESAAGATITDNMQISAGRNNGEVVSYDFPDKALITWSGTTYELPKIDAYISNETIAIKYRLDNIYTSADYPLNFLQIIFTFKLGGEFGCQTYIDLLHGIE